MHVRLTVAWTDPYGMVHVAGDVVDIDAVTLAELEEQGVVEDLDGTSPERVGPGPGGPPDRKDEEVETSTEETPKPKKSGTQQVGPGPGGGDR